MRIFMMLLAVNLVWFSTVSARVQTECGKQCPTAPVQSVFAPVYNCCHKLVGYAMRPVRPGDKQFIQCRCQEKSEVSQKMIANPRHDFYLPVVITFRESEAPSIDAQHFRSPVLADEQSKPEPSNPPPLV